MSTAKGRERYANGLLIAGMILIYVFLQAPTWTWWSLIGLGFGIALLGIGFKLQPLWGKWRNRPRGTIE